MSTAHVLEALSPWCDIVERLKAVPPSARVRGIYFSSVERELERRGLIDGYRDHFSDDRISKLATYPLSEHIVRLAWAGALVASRERLHEGMREISRANSTHFMNSLLGRALLRVLSRDPIRLTEQGLAARRQTNLYGSWKLVRHGPTCIAVEYRDEYVWIESAVAGAALGTFEACGLHPRIDTQLIDRFNGSTTLTW